MYKITDDLLEGLRALSQINFGIEIILDFSSLLKFDIALVMTCWWDSRSEDLQNVEYSLHWHYFQIHSDLNW